MFPYSLHITFLLDIMLSQNIREGRKLTNYTKENLLIQCEAIIKEGLSDMYKVDRALAIINDLQLYENSYQDFEAYCKENWSVKNQYTHLFLKNNKDKNEQ